MLDASTVQLAPLWLEALACRIKHLDRLERFLARLPAGEQDPAIIEQAGAMAGPRSVERRVQQRAGAGCGIHQFRGREHPLALPPPQPPR